MSIQSNWKWLIKDLLFPPIRACGTGTVMIITKDIRIIQGFLRLQLWLLELKGKQKPGIKVGLGWDLKMMREIKNEWCSEGCNFRRIPKENWKGIGSFSSLWLSRHFNLSILIKKNGRHGFTLTHGLKILQFSPINKNGVMSDDHVAGLDALVQFMRAHSSPNSIRNARRRAEGSRPRRDNNPHVRPHPRYGGSNINSVVWKWPANATQGDNQMNPKEPEKRALNLLISYQRLEVDGWWPHNQFAKRTKLDKINVTDY